MTTEQVREAARRLDGRFGEQPKADTGQLDLVTEWVEDGVTPHPTGGYVRVVVLRNNKRFVDASGRPHREDGPAILWNDRVQEWYLSGERHRDDGPAVIHPDDREEWWLNGLLHRSDGPAVICADGTEERWIHGVKVDPDDD